MPKYVIERGIAGTGDLSGEELHGIAEASCGVLRELGGEVQWVQSYLTADKISCVYISPDAEAVREHARRGGFPADVVAEVTTIIDPITAEPATATA